MNQTELLTAMSRAVIEGDAISAAAFAAEWLKMDNANPLKAVEEGLTPGIREVGRLYEEGEYFLPELVTSAEAMKAALNILRPAIVSASGKLEKGVVVMATVEGDIHEIGKTVVSAILEARGFRVYDLGANVKMEILFKRVKEINPDVVGLSALLTTTMVNQKKALEGIRRMNSPAKVIVGGSPVSRAWAEQIGADGYGKDAFEAVQVVERLLGN